LEQNIAAALRFARHWRRLAKRLAITHQAALGLLKQLLEAGIIKEATGRSAWRAFVTTLSIGRDGAK
jgi:DNA-binding Lrp family transcriptional regulator